MYRKKSRFRITLFTVVMLVFSQLMIVAHACPKLLPIANAPAAMSAPMPADCTEMKKAPATSDQPSSLCLAHCQQSSQSHQASAPDLPSAGLVALFEIPRPDTGSSMLSGIVVHHLFLSLTEGSPPLRIQYQVFRI